MMRHVPRLRTDSLLAHTIMRAALIWGDGTGGTWNVMKVTPRASRLSAFMILWALTMREQNVGDGELSPEVYAQQGYESRATVYRRLHEYGELWPDVEINDMGRLVLAAADARKRPDPGVRVKLPALPVAA